MFGKVFNLFKPRSLGGTAPAAPAQIMVDERQLDLQIEDLTRTVERGQEMLQSRAKIWRTQPNIPLHQIFGKDFDDLKAAVAVLLNQLAKLHTQRNRIRLNLRDHAFSDPQRPRQARQIALKLAQARQMGTPEEPRLAFVEILHLHNPELRCDQQFIQGAIFCPRCGRDIKSHRTSPLTLPEHRPQIQTKFDGEPQLIIIDPPYTFF